MAVDASNLSNPLHQNFISVYWGFAYVGQNLEEYTKDGINKVYQRIYRKLVGYTPCDQKCSKTHGNNTSRWCQTCQAWRDELKLKVSCNGDWKKKKSWKWPKESYCIAEMFIPSWWSDDLPDLKDISTACNVWLSCKTEFHINERVIKNIRTFRNKYYAHNPKLQVSDDEKTAVFDTLKDLIRDRDVSAHVNVQQCLKELEIIQNGDQKHIGSLVHSELSNISNNVGPASITQEQLYVTFKYINMSRRQHVKLTVALSPLFVIILALLYNTISDKQPSTSVVHLQNTTFGSNCITEHYLYPFEQDLPLLGYLKNDNEFVGRDWLISNINKDILDIRDNSTRGVVVVADMGYGKSALISHLLCAKTNTKLQNIYKHIVAFHVCKYDVSSTRTPERFIRRLVGFFATKSAEYGNIISRLPSSSILYSLESCSREIEACYDQGISLPLKEIKNTAGETWIIVLDALDECYENKLNKNLILELLSSRSRKLPKWVKFLITSRNMSALSKLDRFNIQNLNPSDPRNVADMKLFMEQKSLDPTEESKSWTSQILKQSEGIFLYLTTFLELNDTRELLQGLPRSLEDIYELNFKRQYDNEDYSLSKNILEIISAQTEPISKKDIFDILNKSDHTGSDKFEQAFERLSFFIHVHDVVSFKHQTILLWVTSKQNGIFAISVANGHALIANYLMSSIKQITFDIAELVIHVAQSENETLRSQFICLKDFENKHKHNRSLLHRIIWKTSSVDALKLLMHHYADVNVINEDGIIPSFVAAAKGHLEQLKYLQSKGEDMSFTVDASINVIDSDIFNKIHLMKVVYHSGYSLLHIAAQHGHISVVEYLIDLIPSMISLKNSVGLRPIDTACENGHLDIVRKLHVARKEFLGMRCLYYASKYNHIDLVKYIVESGLKVNCISDDQSKEAMNSVKSKIFVNANYFCPISQFPSESPNWDKLISPIDSWWLIFKETPLHAAMRSGAIDVAKFILEKFPDAITCSDGFGFTPALTAVAYDRTELMLMFKHRLEHEKCSPIPLHLIDIQKMYGNNYIEHSVCPENSTFAYIAALTGKCRSMCPFTDNLQMKIADVKDVLKRGILHHVVLRNLSNSYDEDGQYCALIMFKYLVETCGHSMRHCDKYRRNILHYAFENGHMLVINYVRTSFVDLYNLLIEEKDINGLSPIPFAIVNNHRHSVYTGQNSGSFVDKSIIKYFNSECFNELMPYWEVVLIRHTCKLNVSKSFVQRHLASYLHEIIIRAPFLTGSLLRFQINISDEIWEEETLKAIYSGGMSLDVMNTIARYRPNIIHKCGKPIAASPMHLFMLKFRPRSSLFPLYLVDVETLLPQLFSNLHNKSQFGCPDENGYNIFHYSLMSGNIANALVVLPYASIINSRISRADIFFLCLSSPIQIPFAEHQYLQDLVLESFIDLNSHTITSKDLCRFNSLSIVHMLAMSGMLNTLQKIFEKYGLETLRCSNRFGVSPLYMAELFGERETAKMLNNYMKLTFPDEAAEEYLLLNMLHNFPLTNVSESISKLLRIRHDGVKKDLRYCYRVYTFVNNLHTLQISNRTLLKEHMMLYYFPFLFTSVSNVGVMLFKKNRTANCTLTRDQINESIRFVLYYKAIIVSDDPELPQAFLPSNTNTLRKIMETIYNILTSKSLIRFIENNGTCSELHESIRSLYPNINMLLGQVSDILQNYAVNHYFLYLKNKPQTLIRSNYFFLQSRQDAFQFPITPFETKPLLKPIEILVRKFRFLDVIKRTWVYQSWLLTTQYGLLHGKYFIKDKLTPMTDPLQQLKKP